MDGGGSHDRCAPSGDLEILIADGAPGKPGRHVLNDEHYAFIGREWESWKIKQKELCDNRLLFD